MREKCVAFMRARKADFLPFLLKEDDDDSVAAAPLEEFDFDDYCARLASAGHWGGEPEVCCFLQFYLIC
jgi:hypothetical protein